MPLAKGTRQFYSLRNTVSVDFEIDLFLFNMHYLLASILIIAVNKLCVDNSFLPYTMKFIPKILDEQRCDNLNELINGIIKRELQLSQQYNYAFDESPRFEYISLLHDQGLISMEVFTSILVQEGLYQIKESDYSNVNLNVHLKRLGTDASENEGIEDAFKEVENSRANPHIQMLPNQRALLVSNWRCNSIFKIGLNGEFKTVLTLKERIDNFCIIIDSQHVTQLAVICRHPTNEGKNVLKFFNCNDDGQVDLRTCVQCAPSFPALPAQENSNLIQFWKRRLVYLSDGLLYFLKYTKKTRLRIYCPSAQEFNPINCLHIYRRKTLWK